MTQPVDADIRQHALDPNESFIVQAPAGSGKTELLTRRVLTLLARVDEPEEILAITFTRKAASEMRQRVVESLQAAQSSTEPANAYEAEGRALAQSVLDRDAALGWQLLRNPQRLNLRTIDALCTQLAHRLPVVSQLGAPAGVVEDAMPLYRQAAANLLDAEAHKLDLLLLQLGNKLEKAQSLLALMLSRRDQWQRYVHREIDPVALRALLEQMLGELVESQLESLVSAMPSGVAGELPVVMRDACRALAVFDEEGVGTETQQNFVTRDDVPGAALDELEAWQYIAQIVLTLDGKVRKTVNRKGGFPVSKDDAALLNVSVDELKARKQHMVELLSWLAEETTFADHLSHVRGLPRGGYTDADWALLEQLLVMLPELVIELLNVFTERGVVDFVEIATRARLALGTEDNPTDLALALDVKLKHILVDEFQDTSQTQFELFNMLVAGWSMHDGRSFFAVGDPMQSIYRFRDADVTLFQRAVENGIGELPLTPLALSVNFRAAPEVINWVNETFGDIFADKPDADSGAVPYSASVAHLETSGGVQVHALVDSDHAAEAMLVAELAQQAIIDDPGHRVAILVRSRAQAGEVFNALQNLDVAYQAIDMDLLGERSAVRDLLSLCLALRYPHDRLHWLAVLRAPWCGLTLNDLHILMEDSKQEAVMDLLRNSERREQLSNDGLARVNRLLGILEPAVKRAPRAALMPWVEACWLQLGGPTVCSDDVDLDAAERCLNRLQSLEASGQLWQPSVLRGAMQSLYAAANDSSGVQVQLMTLHKAKGLEFDTVIVPALARKPRSDSQQLLNWFESSIDNQPRLLLAPITESGAARDPINQLVMEARKRCDAQEKLRLLYVACTRAKYQLHLIAQAKHKADGTLALPDSGSLLHPLWTRLEADFNAAADQVASFQDASLESAPDSGAARQISQLALFGDTEDEVADDGTIRNQEKEAQIDSSAPPLLRLPQTYRMPNLPCYQWPPDSRVESPPPELLEFKWAGAAARCIGTVVHRQLQRIAEHPELLKRCDLVSVEHVVARQLRNLGVPPAHLSNASEKVMKALGNTLADDRGQWILNPAHTEARSEWAVSVREDGRVRQAVIDRTFIDPDGVRWVVDFKTGDHGGGSLDTFLDQEQERYKDQLRGYADIIQLMEQRPLKIGLYFPMVRGWREIAGLNL